MANPVENFRAKPAHDPVKGLFGDVPKDDAPLTAAQLAATAAEERFKKLWNIYLQELDRQAENRFQQSIDVDYYDHRQWSAAEVAEMELRGQAPRVYNKIKPAVDWILGTEKRNRVDWKILPRKKQATEAAQAKTDVMKYISDANHLQYVRSRAFGDAVKVGIGWLTESMEDNDDGEPLTLGWESWRNMLHDSANTDTDIDRGRYVIRTKWVDMDIAAAMFPKQQHTLKLAIEKGFRVGGGQDSDDAMDSQEFSREGYTTAGNNVVNFRDRIRLVEIWYKQPASGKFLRAKGTMAHLNKEPFNEANPAHAEAKDHPLVSVVERQYMQTRVSVMCNKGMLFDAASPYKHNRFPFTVIWGYRRDADNMPYGVIRGIRDPQDDLNKRISKALHILSTNKVIMDKGAVDDLAHFMTEVARPDAVIIKNPNKEIVLNADRDLAAAHMQLMEMDAQMIQDSSGITDENMGRQTNASSGKAIVARQDQGALATAELFDNLRLAIQISGEKALSLMEQYYTDEKEIRLTDSRGNIEWRTVNDGMPENDIANTRGDFIVSQQEFRDSMMLVAQEQLMDMVSKMPPEMGMQFLDVVVEMLPLPNKEEVIKRIKKMTGQVDPNAKLSPEEQAQQQAAQQAAQQQAELQLRAAGAEIGLKEAQAMKTGLEGEVIKQQLAMPAHLNGDPQKLVQENQALQEENAQHKAALQDKSADIEQRHHTALALAGIKAQTELQKADMQAQLQAQQAEQQLAVSSHEAERDRELALQQQQRQHEVDVVQGGEQRNLDRELTEQQLKVQTLMAKEKAKAKPAAAKKSTQKKK